MWTEKEILKEVKRQGYDKPVSLDFMEDAQQAETLEEAAQILIIDSEYWDYDPHG